jgi:hypothetical protein
VTNSRNTQPPDYILAESLSTQVRGLLPQSALRSCFFCVRLQALWHATAARRPQQPEYERREIEKKWEENFKRSQVVVCGKN